MLACNTSGGQAFLAYTPKTGAAASTTMPVSNGPARATSGSSSSSTLVRRSVTVITVDLSDFSIIASTTTISSHAPNTLVQNTLDAPSPNDQSASPSSSAPTTSSLPTSSAMAATTSSSIGAGGIAGAVVGPVAFLALLILAVFGLIIRRRAHQRQRRESALPRGTLGGAVVPGTGDEPSGTGEGTSRHNDNEEAMAEKKKVPPTASVDPYGEPGLNETNRARYEATEAPWSPASITGANPELEDTGIAHRTAYSNYPHEADGASQVGVAIGHPDDVHSPGRATTASRPSPETQHHMSMGSSDPTSGAGSPMSSPRTDRARSPSPGRAGLSVQDGRWGRREPSGLSSNGSWVGYLTAEQAMAGGLWERVASEDGIPEALRVGHGPGAMEADGEERRQSGGLVASSGPVVAHRVMEPHPAPAINETTLASDTPHAIGSRDAHE